MLIVREARAKGSFVKGVRQGTAPKEYMLDGGRNWVWGELHIPTSGMPGADRMADVAQTVCETITVRTAAVRMTDRWRPPVSLPCTDDGRADRISPVRALCAFARMKSGSAFQWRIGAKSSPLGPQIFPRVSNPQLAFNRKLSESRRSLMPFMIAKSVDKTHIRAKQKMEGANGRRQALRAHSGGRGRGSQRRASPDGSLPVVALSSSSAAVRSEVDRIAALGGIDVEHVADGGADAAVLNLSEVRASAVKVRARFHPAYAPYFAWGSLELTLPDEAEDLLELLLAAGTTRRGQIVGVVGVHGGAGASTVAAWLARTLEGRFRVALVDADQCSAGADRLLALDGQAGVRWADLRSDSGVLVPGRLLNSLPSERGLAVLSADDRGAMPSGEAGEAAVAALSQVRDLCVIDLPGEALIEGSAAHRLLGWLDVVVLVARGGSGPARQLARAVANVPAGVGILVAALGVRGGEAAVWGRDLGIDSVYPVRLLSGLAGDVEHGVGVGERKRSATARDLAVLARACGGLQ